jgi:ribosomal protein S18 acetylase RimI-like enzyme
VAELKRLYRRPNASGVGNAILKTLEAEAITAGYRTLVAETRAINRRAIAFYERNGFVCIERFGMYASQADARCFAKQLAHAPDAGPTSTRHADNDSIKRGKSD